MKNSISVCGLSEFTNEIKRRPEQARATYGVRLQWDSGARSSISTQPMILGQHRLNRPFAWQIDEPRQLLGTNHAPNPQEYLLSGFAACIMMAFVSGVTARGLQLESLAIEVKGELDLHGLLGLDSDQPVGFGAIDYTLTVSGEASESEFEELLALAQAHSPNAMSLANPVALNGRVVVVDEAKELA